jgi:hypothetical protein
MFVFGGESSIVREFSFIILEIKSMLLVFLAADVLDIRLSWFS